MSPCSLVHRPPFNENSVENLFHQLMEKGFARMENIGQQGKALPGRFTVETLNKEK